MKKFISAASALAMAASMFAVAVPATVNAATSASDLEQSKTLSLRAINETDSAIESLGNTIEVSADAIAAGDVTIPCALYIEATQEGDFNSLASIFGVSADSKDASAMSLSTRTGSDALTYDAYSSAHTFTIAGGATLSMTQRPFFSGEDLFGMGMYSAHGDIQVDYQDSRASFGIDLPTISTTWVYVSGDNWLGDTSDAFPYLYFDVTLKQGAAAGDYIIDFYDFYKDEAELQPSNLLGSVVTNFEYSNIMQSKTGEGKIEFEPLTITVKGDAEVESTTAAPTTAAPTTEAPTVEDTTAGGTTEGGIVFSYAQEEYTANAGDKLVLQLFCDTNGRGIAAYDGSLLVSDTENMEITTVVGSCMAAGTNFTVNWLSQFLAQDANNTAADFTDRNGNAVSALIAGPTTTTVDGNLVEQALTSDKVFLMYQLQLSENIPDGRYYVTMPTVMLQGKVTGADEPVDWVDDADITKATAKIVVGEVPTDADTTVEDTTVEDTTAAPTTVAPTTAEPTTAEPTAEPTLDPNGRVLGDANCNDVVNVADVVVLNKYLAGKGELTDQGKVNAEVSDPTYDVAAVDLTTDDSSYIIKSIIHLYDLTADGPVATEYNK